MREVYKYTQFNCYIYRHWKTRALRRSWSLLLALNSSKLFSRASSNEGRPAVGLSTRNCFLLPQKASLALASSYFLRDLTKIDCTKRDQIYYVPRYTEHLPPQSRQRCGQSFGPQPHQQLMMQQFLHQTVTPVYPCLPSFFSTSSRHNKRSATTCTPITPQGSN